METKVESNANQEIEVSPNNISLLCPECKKRDIIVEFKSGKNGINLQ